MMDGLRLDERAAPFRVSRWLGRVLSFTVGALVSLELLGCAHGVEWASQNSNVSADEDADHHAGVTMDATFPEAEAASGAEAGATDSAGDGGARDEGGDADATYDGGDAGPSLVATSQVCKLINGQAESDPTANKAATLANLAGTELGIPVEVGGTLYFFFGDSHGYKGIWAPNQSLPDAVGYSLDSATALATTPDLLCSDLRFLTLSSASSLGPTIDPSIMADFAATAMNAPVGQQIGSFVHNPSGDSQTTWWQNLPGTSEVPSGAFSYGSDLYVLYTTVAAPTDTTMKASYLARWSGPTTHDIPSFNILYSVDERFDSAGALYGDFINVATETSGNYVYLFGTGDFRKSPVRLARKALSSLDTAGSFELYDAASGTWGSSRGAPIVTTPGYGETSVRYFSAINRWMFLAADLDMHTQIVARFADKPEGPWSAPVIVEDMADPAFISQYCCGTTCAGSQMIHCSQGTLYGAYLLPEIAVHADGSFTVTYTMSTGNPYDVVLMKATFSG
jgi:hypothetical protein